MLLADAAIISENLRNLYRNYMTDAKNRSTYFRKIVDIVRIAIDNTTEDVSQLVDILYPEYSKYPRQFVSFRELRGDICKKLSISPLVWDESLAGKPIVPLIALESAEYGGQGMTVKQALNLMARIKDEGFFQIASKMNEREALVFWSRATDERPPMPMNRFLQIVSYAKEGGAQSLQSINVMMQTMTPAEIIQKIFSKTDDIEVRTMQPGQAFLGPVYRAWDKMITPADVYADVLSNSRRYLHITEFPKGTFKGILYNRHKQVMGKPTTLPFEGIEGVFEVEVDGLQIHYLTDVLAVNDNWEIYKMDYKDRLDHLENMPSPNHPVKRGKFISASTDFTHILETLEEGQRLRLLSTGPIKLGGDGGWSILKDAFHLNLLVSAIKRDEQFETVVRMSAMDGFETYEVGQANLSVEAAQHMRHRLAQHSVLVGQDWIPVDEYAMVVVAEMKEFSLDSLTIEKVEVSYLDDNLGYSDVSQLTDLIEMSA